MEKLNSSLEKIIADYKSEPDVDTLKAVFDAFELLANNIFKYFVQHSKVAKEVFKNKSKIIRELVCVAFIKMQRYDPTKGRAFNFFTTIMLGWLRQIYRSKKDLRRIKD